MGCIGGAGLIRAQATAATKKYLEAIMTAGVLHEIATLDEMTTLIEQISHAPASG